MSLSRRTSSGDTVADKILKEYILDAEERATVALLNTHLPSIPKYERLTSSENSADYRPVVVYGGSCCCLIIPLIIIWAFLVFFAIPSYMDNVCMKNSEGHPAYHKYSFDRTEADDKCVRAINLLEILLLGYL